MENQDDGELKGFGGEVTACQRTKSLRQASCLFVEGRPFLGMWAVRNEKIHLTFLSVKAVAYLPICCLFASQKNTPRCLFHYTAAGTPTGGWEHSPCWILVASLVFHQEPRAVNPTPPCAVVALVFAR